MQVVTVLHALYGSCRQLAPASAAQKGGTVAEPVTTFAQLLHAPSPPSYVEQEIGPLLEPLPLPLELAPELLVVPELLAVPELLPLLEAVPLLEVVPLLVAPELLPLLDALPSSPVLV